VGSTCARRRGRLKTRRGFRRGDRGEGAQGREAPCVPSRLHGMLHRAAGPLRSTNPPPVPSQLHRSHRGRGHVRDRGARPQGTMRASPSRREYDPGPLRLRPLSAPSSWGLRPPDPVETPVSALAEPVPACPATAPPS
jgi:hypothetical protein